MSVRIQSHVSLACHIKLMIKHSFLPHQLCVFAMIMAIAALCARPVQAADLVATMAARADLSDFYGLLRMAGLEGRLKSLPAATVFAPTNAAIAALPPGAWASLQGAANRARAERFVLFHVVGRRLTEDELDDRETMLPTLEGGAIHVDADDGGFLVEDAQLVGQPQAATNGILFALDHVLVPH